MEDALARLRAIPGVRGFSSHGDCGTVDAE